MTSSDLYLTNLLAAFATTVSSSIEQEVAKVGCRSHNAATALVTIRNHPNDSIDTLRSILHVTHSGAVRLINGLEEDQLVARHRSESDGRSVVLRLTKKGQSMAKQVLHARTNIASSVLSSIPKAQQDELRPILENSLKKLTEEPVKARWICRLCDEPVCRPQGCPVEIAACLNRASESQ